MTRIPVACEYTIDSEVTFSRDARSRYGLPEVPDTFARAFLQSVVGVLASHDPPLLRARDEDRLCIRNTDLTDLGLDFMRQHYHKLKEEALARRRLPRPSELRRLIVETENHRTTDSDWRLEEP
jgi:hypothetical protein